MLEKETKEVFEKKGLFIATGGTVTSYAYL